jgi:hypothetical protein
MKKFLYNMTVAFLFTFSFLFFMQPAHGSTNWEAFSINIEHSIKNGNLGVQQSALLHIVKYGEKLNVQGALDDVIKLYKNGQDEKTRELALLAIFRIDNKTALELLNERVQEEFDTIMQEKLNKYLTKF